MKHSRSRWIAIGGFLLVVLAAVWLEHPDNSRFTGAKEVSVALGEQLPVARRTESDTVGAFLEEIHWPHSPEDAVWPSLDTKLYTGMQIRVWPSRTVTLAVGGEEKTVAVTGIRIQDILDEEHIALDALDIIQPSLDAAVSAGERIEIIRVTVSEEAEEQPIAFDKKTVEDDTLSWRVKKVTQPGKNGKKKNTYRVSRHNGEIVGKELIASETLEEPATEITTVGTKVAVGKKHSGQASWYSYSGTLSAANPWLPLGSYVRVTNTANGKSVIVQINDRGPFGAGRIVDLDKVAFQKIASLGEGVISVIMEEITN